MKIVDVVRLVVLVGVAVLGHIVCGSMRLEVEVSVVGNIRNKVTVTTVIDEFGARSIVVGLYMLDFWNQKLKLSSWFNLKLLLIGK